MKRKPIFIIPGFRHRPKNKAYKTIAKMLKSQGYQPISVTIPWKQTTISQNTDYFLKQYKKIKTRKKYIFGFSFGAMIAFLASTKVNPTGVILCSLSPYFKEDVVKVRHRFLSPISEEQYQDFLRLRCSTLAKQIKARQILMLYGAKESKPLIARVNRAFYHIPTRNKYLVSIHETEHNISDRRYLYAIDQVVKVFN